MKRFSRRPRAAFLFAASLVLPPLALTPSAQAAQVEVPAYRALGAQETMASPSQSGTDYSANAPSLSGLTLLATIPAATQPRLGYLIQAQCTAGLTVALDDAAGALAPTIIVLAGPSTNGGQGGSLTMAGMPHTGRIRIYASSSSCQMAARVW
jgi:hypothetical protein